MVRLEFPVDEEMTLAWLRVFLGMLRASGDSRAVVRMAIVDTERQIEELEGKAMSDIGKLLKDAEALYESLLDQASTAKFIVEGLKREIENAESAQDTERCAREIAAVMLRARSLSGVEIIALSAMRRLDDFEKGDGIDDAWDAMWGAMETCSAGVALDAVRNAVLTFDWDNRSSDHSTAVDTIENVVCALFMRSLIDEATPWNQAAYDLLVAPWAAVIGPAHPDDRGENRRKH